MHLPDEMDFVSAAAAGCRFMTAYHGVVDRAQVRPAEWICVFGLGGIGLSVVQIASMRGAQAIAVDIDNEKLKLAEAEGAVATINAAEVDAVEAVKEITGGGSHVSVDALGGAVTTQPAVKSLRKGGRHLQLGMSDASDEGIVGMPMDMITVNEITIVGSVGCPTTSYPRAAHFYRQRNTGPEQARLSDDSGREGERRPALYERLQHRRFQRHYGMVIAAARPCRSHCE